MGCRAFTPHLVGLAKELEGAPFHFIASHNQSGSPEAALHEIFQNGLEPFAPNVTVTKQAGHPGVKGTGYVPYYLLFDHHGDLVHHHQGGPYHGGDGTAVLDRVREMLRSVPVVYVGKDPFERHHKLAAELEKGKKLSKSLEALARAHAENPEDSELTRLVAGVVRYRDRLIATFAAQLPTDPGGVIKDLKSAVKDFAGTPWSAPLDELLAQLQDRSVSRLHEESASSLRSALARLDRLERVAGNGGKVLNPLDAKFRAENERDLEQIKRALKELRDEHSALPAGKRAGELLALLE